MKNWWPDIYWWASAVAILAGLVMILVVIAGMVVKGGAP